MLTLTEEERAKIGAPTQEESVRLAEDFINVHPDISNVTPVSENQAATSGCGCGQYGPPENSC